MGNIEKDLPIKSRAYEDLSAIVENAFLPGPCTCVRCKESCGDNSSYKQKHTFEINGELFRRSFSKTSYSDLLASLEKSWLSFFGEKIKPNDALPVDSFEFTLKSCLKERFFILARESGLASIDGNEFKILPPEEIKVEKKKSGRRKN